MFANGNLYFLLQPILLVCEEIHFIPRIDLVHTCKIGAVVDMGPELVYLLPSPFSWRVRIPNVKCKILSHDLDKKPDLLTAHIVRNSTNHSGIQSELGALRASLAGLLL